MKRYLVLVGCLIAVFTIYWGTSQATCQIPVEEASVPEVGNAGTVEVVECDSVASDEKLKVEKKAKSDKSDKKKKDKKKKAEEKGKDLKKTIADLKASIVAKDSVLTQKQGEIDSLQAILDELLPFRLELLKKQCENIAEFERLPFSSISEAKIDSVRSKIKPFISSSPELAENDSRLQILSDNKRVYGRFHSLMDSIPYGEELKSEYVLFQDELSSDSIPSHRIEIKELEKRMKAYPALVPKFGEVIFEFQIQLEYARNNNDLSDAKDMAKETLKRNKNFKDAKEKMSQVPYMKSLLDEYLGLLLGKNPLDERIIQIEDIVRSMSESVPGKGKK